MSSYKARDRKSTKRSFLAMQSFLLIVFVAPATAATFKAGAARIDITPPPGLPMYGFFERIIYKVWAWSLKSPFMYNTIGLLQKWDLRRRAKRSGWVQSMPSVGPPSLSPTWPATRKPR